MNILIISTDKKVFEPKSEVRLRIYDYASEVGNLFVVTLGNNRGLEMEGHIKFLGLSRWRAFFWQPKEKYDLVTSQDPFETGLIARRLAKILGAQLELQIHTDIGSYYFRRESLKNRFRFFLARLLLPKADKIRVVSQRIKNYLVSNLGIAESKIYVKPIFVDIEKIKQTPITIDLRKKYPQFDQIILMASRLTKEKNIGLAIEAMREVVKQKPKTGLVIAGSGSEEKSLKLKTKSYKLEVTVVFEPWINHETLVSYYKTCDLFLLTSWYEGYGMTLVEAQAAGCKIVSTDVGVARGLVENDKSGFIVLAGNPNQLSRAIKQALS